MSPFTTTGYEIDTNHERMDLDLVHQWLSTDAFWALGRSRETVETAAGNSLNFGVFAGDGTQVAYARVVTDGVTFAWVCDVYVSRPHRGRGLGSWLSEAIVAELRPMGLKRVLLSTRDAHEVYARVGFVPVPNPEKLMILDDAGNQPTHNAVRARKPATPALSLPAGPRATTPAWDDSPRNRAHP